ncbi:MAG: hypothetical protein HY682_10280 [Chloroflexi bacterium]|nr:hypothetical protein [Chloroflexota bacterium]
MLTRETTLDARQRELEKVYEEAFRYAMTYHTGWDQVEKAAARLRAFMAEQGMRKAIAA